VLWTNEPRESFSDKEIRVLDEIATVITNHLEFVRMKQDYHRVGRLMQGLGSFVEGESRLSEHRSPDTMNLQTATQNAKQEPDTVNNQKVTTEKLFNKAMLEGSLPPSSESSANIHSTPSASLASISSATEFFQPDSGSPMPTSHSEGSRTETSPGRRPVSGIRVN